MTYSPCYVECERSVDVCTMLCDMADVMLCVLHQHCVSFPQGGEHCYYHGQVRGNENSRAALSTCKGLQ